MADIRFPIIRAVGRRGGRRGRRGTMRSCQLCGCDLKAGDGVTEMLDGTVEANLSGTRGSNQKNDQVLDEAFFLEERQCE